GGGASVMAADEGPPLRLVHGHSACWQSWLDNWPFFAERSRVIAPDAPGFGYSEGPAEGVSIENYARCLDALCQELEIESAPVVGNSLGGFVGAELCLKFPRRVTRLVLVAAAGLADRYIGLPSGLLRRQSVAAFARAIN